MKYFLAHASQWLSWKNVALSVHAKVAPCTARRRRRRRLKGIHSRPDTNRTGAEGLSF